MDELSKRITALSPGKLALLSRRLEEKGSAVASAQTIPRRRGGQRNPLSFAQQRLWFLHRLRPGDPTYNIPLAVRLGGELHAAALDRTMREIVRRHEVLRTTFVAEGGLPVQVVAPAPASIFTTVDLSGLGPAEREREARRLAQEEAARPFKLAEGPLLRAVLLRLAAAEHVVLLTLHHIVGDAWSMEVLVEEVSELYNAFSLGQAPRLAALPIQYADYAVWQREWLQGEMLEAQLAFWREQLRGEPPALELPTDRARPPVSTHRGASHSFTLPKGLGECITRLGREEGATLFMTLLAAFQVLLARYSGQEDVSVGTPIAGRRQAEVEHLVGFFVNTLVLRTDLSGRPTFREVLRRVRDVCLGAYSHQDLPFELLVEELQPERHLSRTPLFQVMFALKHEPPQPRLGGLELRPLKVEGATARFDLTLTMQEAEGELEGSVEYSTDLFEAATIARLVGHLEQLLRGVAADPDRRLSDLPLLTDAEARLILVEWNETGMDAPRDERLQELFAAQAASSPEAVAVVGGDGALTYAELNRRSDLLACHLQTLGVGPETPVGICLERSPWLIVGLLGILKAGGAYVPLDARYPRERLSFTFADARLAVLLTQESLLGVLPPFDEVVCLDRDWPAISRGDGSVEARVGGGRQTAYVIYTSGSTGRPKGVAIEHRSAASLVRWAQRCFSAEELGGVLASTSICFDLSVFEIFAPLCTGGAVIMADNALQLPRLPAARQVTLLNTVPSAAAELVRSGGIPPTVRTVALAGEPLSRTLVRQLYELGSVGRVLNLYGPTEDTTYSTRAEVGRQGDAAPDIGRPVGNKRAYILDRHLGPVPVGVVGELYVGGVGVARGYLNRPALTAEKFLPDPFGPEAGARLYRTGDRARYLPDGRIEFLGRNDHQVKLRGFRIELGEIEAVLAGHPSVAEAAVVVGGGERDDGRLLAYVVTRASEPASARELRDFLKQALPDYMIPSALVFLDALPLTPNGKVDRRALWAQAGAAPEPEQAYVAPRTDAEKMLAGIWAEVLQVERVGRDDNFFDLGGHSLLATQVVARVGDISDLELPLEAIFDAPTVAELALRVEALSAEMGEGK
jgi:amino acid adenylation domain-containing protein